MSNMISSDTAMIPQRVVTKALELGAHEDCIEADWDGSCDSCRLAFLTAFDSFYSMADNADEALMMIINDILEDRDTTRND